VSARIRLAGPLSFGSVQNRGPKTNMEAAGSKAKIRSTAPLFGVHATLVRPAGPENASAQLGSARPFCFAARVG
jgi:hypothetical protein